jgi:hypothetical protein
MAALKKGELKITPGKEMLPFTRVKIIFHEMVYFVIQYASLPCKVE